MDTTTSSTKKNKSISKLSSMRVSPISNTSTSPFSLKLPLEADFRRYAVDTQQGFENVLVLDNIPIVDESKRQRLMDRLRQVFDKAGAGLAEDRITMPWDDKAATNKGCVRSLWILRMLTIQVPLFDLSGWPTS